ncbi:MAG: Hsp20/alpha crystallin family protein [Planctomycetes bacterium]|nr:Hsp20/alpha crystallin family protein [Planctomycetota bacterium]
MALLPKRKKDREERYPVLSLRDEMNRLFDDFFGGGLLRAPLGSEWLPALDVSETDTGIVVRAEVPGIAPEDIDISLTGDTLIIKGEKKQEEKKEEENYYRMERCYGSFQRVVTLPGSVDASKVTATHKNGVLTVTLEKKEESKAKVIDIKVQ